MNQISKVPFGVNAALMSGYAVTANDRLGNIDFVVENTGDNTLSMQFRELNAAGSGYTPIGSFFTVVPQGVVTKSLSLVSKKIGFFGSGSTTANISTVIRNKADLRGAQVDLAITGRRNFGYDTAYNTGANGPAWPTLPQS